MNPQNHESESFKVLYKSKCQSPLVGSELLDSSLTPIVSKIKIKDRCY